MVRCDGYFGTLLGDFSFYLGLKTIYVCSRCCGHFGVSRPASPPPIMKFISASFHLIGGAYTTVVLTKDIIGMDTGTGVACRLFDWTERRVDTRFWLEPSDMHIQFPRCSPMFDLCRFPSTLKNLAWFFYPDMRVQHPRWIVAAPCCDAMNPNS